MHNALSRRSDAAWIAALRERGPQSARACVQLIAYLRAIVTHHSWGRLARPDVEDLVHDSLVRIVANLDAYRRESSFLSWAAGVTWRVVADEFRGRERRRRALQGFVTVAAQAPGLGPDDALERAERSTVLERAIATRLSERQRLAIVGELAGEPTAALARRLGVTPNALYKLTHDARRKLRCALNEAERRPPCSADASVQLDACPTKDSSPPNDQRACIR